MKYKNGAVLLFCNLLTDIMFVPEVDW